MSKHFDEIKTYSEYLLLVDMGPEKYPNLWSDKCIECNGDHLRYVSRSQNGELNRGTCWHCNKGKVSWRCLAPFERITNCPAENKWDYLSKILAMIGPEMDARGFSYECFLESIDHLTILEDFYFWTVSEEMK